MQVTETLNEGLKRKLAVVIPASDLNERLDVRLDEIKGQANIKGFRPGKVPMNHLKKLYGRSAMSEVMSDAINATVAKVASGAAETVPYFMVTNLARTLNELKERNIWIIGTSDQATSNLYQADLKGPVALVLGAEGDGMRRLTRDTCDQLVTIPMLGSVQSLNVSVASGVCLYEARRRRT